MGQSRVFPRWRATLADRGAVMCGQPEGSIAGKSFRFVHKLLDGFHT